MSENNYKLSSSPHIRDKVTSSNIMLMVVIALLPASAFGVYNFGIPALIVLISTTVSAVLTEYIYEKLMHKKITINDWSAVVTGLLLGLNMPASAPWWMGALGSVFAILVVKQLFGGLGQNFMNPALGARCFLLISFAGPMTKFVYDGVSGPTPLATLKDGGSVDSMKMLIGTIPGTIGETSVIAIIIGAVFLIMLGVIDLRIPGTYIVSFVIFVGIFGPFTKAHVGFFDPQYITAHLCGGGLMLGAWFMATDYVTSPITKKGQYVYGILLGVLTGLFRLFGGSAEGVSYAIIISNLLVPLIERVTLPKPFGKGGEKIMKKNPIIKNALILTIITLIAGLGLGFVYEITKNPIAQAQEKAKKEAWQAVFTDVDANAFEAQDVDAKIADKAIKSVGAKATVDEVCKAGDKGYVITTTDKEGYGGDIQITVGITSDGTVNGISILSISETAGLGMKAKEPKFYNQYKGKKAEKFVVSKDGGDGEQIDAISGATITSRAVTGAVNVALAYYQNAF